jgi:hypothetical protein
VKFTYLPESLHKSAEVLSKYLREMYGLSKAAIAVEESIDDGIEFNPTFSARLKDQHLLCAELNDQLLHPTIHYFISECQSNVLPVKLFLAYPKGVEIKDYPTRIKIAQSLGVGIIEVTERTCRVIQHPVTLSVTGVRRPKFSNYRPAYRQALVGATSTFTNGNPNKACSDVYDEIENLCRRIGVRVSKKGLFIGNEPNWGKDSFANIVEYLSANLRPGPAGCPNLKKPLWSRIYGITEYRNDSGHKNITTLNELSRRDATLRTRFESACDILLELIEASAPLRP